MGLPVVLDAGDHPAVLFGRLCLSSRARDVDKRGDTPSGSRTNGMIRGAERHRQRGTLSSKSTEATGLVVLARPEGSERTPPTIVVEGVAELVEALRAA
jgi:hypothetical protein